MNFYGNGRGEFDSLCLTTLHLRRWTTVPWHMAELYPTHLLKIFYFLHCPLIESRDTKHLLWQTLDPFTIPNLSVFEFSQQNNCSSKNFGVLQNGLFLHSAHWIPLEWRSEEDCGHFPQLYTKELWLLSGNGKFRFQVIFATLFGYNIILL